MTRRSRRSRPRLQSSGVSNYVLDAARSAIFSGRSARVDLLRSGELGHADDRRFRGGGRMLKLPPPVWALAYTLIAVGASYLLGWPRVVRLALVWPGVVLIVLGIGLSVKAAMLFRREDTEVNPTSPANRKLVTSGPFRLTRNPMYLGLVLATLGVALWVGAWPMLLAQSPSSPPQIGCIFRSRRRRCAASSARRSTPTPTRHGGGFERRARQAQSDAADPKRAK